MFPKYPAAVIPGGKCRARDRNPLGQAGTAEDDRSRRVDTYKHQGSQGVVPKPAPRWQPEHRIRDVTIDCRCSRINCVTDVRDEVIAARLGLDVPWLSRIVTQSPAQVAHDVLHGADFAPAAPDLFQQFSLGDNPVAV